MANFNEIIQEINTNLPDNNTQSITAKKLRDTMIYTLYGTEEDYDISANNNGTKYINLTAALGTDGVNVPTDVRKGGMSIRFINSDGKYEQWRYMGTSIANADFANVSNWQGVDDEPAAGSQNFVESGGVITSIRDAALAMSNASSLIGEWVVDGTAVTFDGTGMNGTFTSHTAPNKPKSTRPYFRFQNFETGKKYRIRLKVSINSSRTDEIGFDYAHRQNADWEDYRLIDVDSNKAADIINGRYMDCVFTAQSSKTYIIFTMTDFGIDETVTISEFAFYEVKDIDEINNQVNEQGVLVENTAKYALNNYLIGKGQTYVSRQIHGLVPGHNYRAYIKNPNWGTTGITGDTNYKFLIRNDYNGSYNLLVEVRLPDNVSPYYDFTIPTNSDYITVGGRAVVDEIIEFDIVDITNSIKNTGWDRIINVADAIYSGRTSKAYKFIFYADDLFNFVSYVDVSGLYLKVKEFETYAQALSDDSSGIYIGGGYVEVKNPSEYVNGVYAVGTSKHANRFISFVIKKLDASDINDSDVQSILQKMNIQIYPYSTIVQEKEISNLAKMANGISLNASSLWEYMSNVNGYAGVGGRIKFFDFNFVGEKDLSVDISSVLSTISNLQYSFGVWTNILSAENSSSSGRIEYNSTWLDANISNRRLHSSGVFAIYFKKSDNSAFTISEYESLCSTIGITISTPSYNNDDARENYIFSINHRGYSTTAPENTLPAFILSRKKGFNFVETDVAFTSDNVAVLMHDSTINRTARNSDGTQLSETLYIYDITYAQALQYDYGIWKGAEWAGTKIPTFLEFIQLCKQLSITPFIELKDSVEWTVERCENIAESIKAVGMEKHVAFISFSSVALQRISALFPEAMIGLGYERTYDISGITSLVNSALALQTQTNKVLVSLRYSAMTSELYQIVADAGINSIVWTVNNASDAVNLNDNTVGVLSDLLNAGDLILDDLYSTLPVGI